MRDKIKAVGVATRDGFGRQTDIRHFTPTAPSVNVDAVTLPPKRYSYIYVCAGCDLLDQSERSDTLTCSPACRVAAHRNGAAAALRQLAVAAKVSPALILRAKALQQLCPGIVERVMHGEVEIDDLEVRGAMHRALFALVQKAPDQGHAS